MLILSSDQAAWKELQSGLLYAGDHSLLQMSFLRSHLGTRVEIILTSVLIQ